MKWWSFVFEGNFPSWKEKNEKLPHHGRSTRKDVLRSQWADLIIICDATSGAGGCGDCCQHERPGRHRRLAQCHHFPTVSYISLFVVTDFSFIFLVVTLTKKWFSFSIFVGPADFCGVWTCASCFYLLSLIYFKANSKCKSTASYTRPTSISCALYLLDKKLFSLFLKKIGTLFTHRPILVSTTSSCAATITTTTTTSFPTATTNFSSSFTNATTTTSSSFTNATTTITSSSLLLLLLLLVLGFLLLVLLLALGFLLLLLLVLICYCYYYY